MDKNTPCILFADDDPDVLELLVLGAKRRGWQTETATRAKEIVDKVNERCNPVDFDIDDPQKNGRCFDAIVTDINFQNRAFDPSDPKLSATSAIKAVRKQYPNIPVIFYTGFDTVMVREQANRAGGLLSDFIVKSKPEAYELHKSEIERVMDRIQNLMVWVRERIPYAGPERRLDSSDIGLRRRKGESGSGELVRISPTLTRILEERRESVLMRNFEK